MTMMVLVSTALLCAADTVFTYRRLKTFLHIFQQEEYDAPRFLRWLWAQRAFDRTATAGLVLIGLVVLASHGLHGFAPLLAAMLLAAASRREADPRQGKKPLAMTARARRLLNLAACLMIVPVVLLIAYPIIGTILAVQIVPLALVLATILLAPYERRHNRVFINEAQEKLASLKPTIVGITGSFGKTSVKHILGHLLSMQAPTLVTPGSVNTELGITRIVREKLAARERFFVCEMGAYGIGSIARLCSLAPPDIGVITAIGHAHYERFKSLDAVVRAKFELAESVVARHGSVIVHQSVLDHSHAADFVARHRAQCVVVGSGESADMCVLETGQTSDGVFAIVRWRGEIHKLAAKLFGQHHAGNMALAFATAIIAGGDAADLALAIGKTPQIKHRSEVKAHASGAVLIDDAYNSNPSGFAGALPLLDLLRKDGRRVLVTPGMVELGTAHDTEHAKIGFLAAAHVDIFLPVLPARLGSMIDAYRAGAPDGQVVPQAGLQPALAWMDAHLRAGDVVLLENDLPDLYERRLRL